MQSCKPEQGRARSEEAGWRRGGRMEREKEQFRRMKGMKEGEGREVEIYGWRGPS